MWRFEWILPRGIDYVPVNYAAAQMTAAVKTAECCGFNLGSKGTKKRKEAQRKAGGKSDGKSDNQATRQLTHPAKPRSA